MATTASPPARRRRVTPTDPTETGRRRRLPAVLRTALLVVLGLLGALALLLVVPFTRDRADATTSRLLDALIGPVVPPAHRLGKQLPVGSKVVAADGTTVLATLNDGPASHPVALSSLAPTTVNAVLAAEDAKYWHEGFIDPLGITRAMLTDVTGHGHQGGSTIVQQLAKLNYTNGHRTYARKLVELWYAARLSRTYDKRALLERYINQVYLGEGALGLESGAREYFGTDAAHLSPAQAALLAGLIRAPQTLDPRSNPTGARTRRDQVLRNMGRHGWLSAPDLAAALATPVQLVPQPPSATAGPSAYFVELVKREAGGLSALGDSESERLQRLLGSGFTVQTTLDPGAEQAATAAVGGVLNRPGDPQAAVVSVQPGDGAIRALFSGTDFAHQQFDIASQAHRQPGSSFKPFVYLAALRAGIDPRSMLSSASPMQLSYQGQSYQVRNAEPGSGQDLSIDQALAESVNTVFAQLTLKVGPPAVVSAARDDGIGEPIPAVPAVGLGGLRQGVSPLEMAAAYATFAAGGVYATPYSITSIVDPHGKALYRHTAETHPVFTAAQVGVLTKALEGTIQFGTGTAAALGRPVAGKTGTTTNFVDAWFVGYVPQLATAVWVGDAAKSTPMTDVHGISVFGGTFPAQIFAATMRAELAHVPPADLAVASPDALNLHPLVPSTLPPLGPVPSSPAASTTTPPSSTTVPSGGPTTTTGSPSTTSPSASTTTPTTTGGHSTTTG